MKPRLQGTSEADNRYRPIAFAPQMILAILAGTKTQTRRVIQPQPDLVLRPAGLPNVLRQKGKAIRNRFGDVGDLLWVRETWARQANRFVYAADGPIEPPRFYPASVMPRAAARILLRINSIRVERLDEISPADAKREGCPRAFRANAIDWFRNLWNSLAPPDAQWRDTPWVWVIDFEIAERPASRAKPAPRPRRAPC